MAENNFDKELIQARIQAREDFIKQVNERNTRLGIGGTPSGTSTTKTIAPPPVTPKSKPNQDVAKGSSSYDPYSYYRKVLGDWNLGGLYDALRGAIKDIPAGDATAVLNKIRESKQYQDRFKGMAEIVRNQGQPISEADYLSTERSYREVLKSYGFQANQLLTDSKGQYLDENTTYAKLIGGAVSPIEFNARIRAASEWTKGVNPGAREALRKFYNIQDKDLVRYALNPTGGQLELERIAATARIGGEALKEGFDLFGTAATGTTAPEDKLSKTFIEDLATRGTGPSELGGLTGEAADAKRAQLQESAQTAATLAITGAAEERTNLERLAAISGRGVSAQEQVEAQFAGIQGVPVGETKAGRQAKRKIDRIRSEEVARFRPRGSSAGLFGEDVSGSF